VTAGLDFRGDDGVAVSSPINALWDVALVP
jgi:hypothetical protein